MKNRISFVLMFTFAILSITSCKIKPKTDCCKENPYEMHLSARELMQTYQDLVKTVGVDTGNFTHPTRFVSMQIGKIQVDTCFLGISPKTSFNVSSAMRISGYGGNSDSLGVLTFTSFYYQDSAVFRTIWGGHPCNFIWYCAYPPQPIIFPLTGPNKENHVYEARLIPVADYQAATGPKNYVSLRGIGVIPIKDITAINTIRLEPSTGYINRTEPTLYSNVFSSKGFVCDVSIKGKTNTIPCYIINNYDTLGTLTWKVKAECQ